LEAEFFLFLVEEIAREIGQFFYERKFLFRVTNSLAARVRAD